VTPSAPLPPAPATPSGAAAADGAPAPVAPVASSTATPPPPYAEPRDTPVADAPRRRQRHSTGMMAGGIVMVSFVPIALLVAWVASIEQSACEHGTYYNGSIQTAGVDCDRFNPTIYGGLLGAAALAGAGIPMIVIGGKKEPVGIARLAPWASPHGAGLGLRFDL
jgi:hypothetical protein